jgi:FkbM family methyltransferase
LTIRGFQYKKVSSIKQPDRKDVRMIRSDAKSWPPRRYLRKLHRKILELRSWLVRELEIADQASVYRFRCGTVREFNRCLKLYSKEPGTIEWIKSEMKPGQIFYDIGANIGVYTIIAARQVAPGGKVYAFEPHGPNFSRLSDNIALNHLQGVVVPCSFALHNTEGYLNFRYDSLNSGTSNSQLFTDSNGEINLADDQIVELKHAIRVDALLASRRVAPPQHVKIDIDGNEYLILQGMTSLLRSSDAPLSIQVELNEPHTNAIIAFLQDHKYHLVKKHLTRSAARRMEQLADHVDSGCNGIFKRSR